MRSQHLASEPVRYEIGNGEIFLPAQPGLKGFEHQAELARHREQPAAENGQNFGGHQKEHPFRQLLQLPLQQDVGFSPVIVARDQLVRQAQGPAEFDSRRFLREEGIRAAFQDEPSGALRDDDASQARAAFDQLNADICSRFLRVLLQKIGCR